MYALIAHGGAGEHSNQRKAIEGVREAVKVGKKILESNGDSIDAVEETINVLEELCQFNAGKGSVLTIDGEIKMDACLATSNNEIGAVTNIEDIKNPISFARKILEKTNHVFLGGKEATKLARKMGFEEFNPYTSDRINKHKEKINNFSKEQVNNLNDTVGAVAVDKEGKLVAGTSTGGKSLKLNGRIGDSPIYGAGTYVNKEIASSATGNGEAIIKSLITKKTASLKKTNDLKNSLELALKDLEKKIEEEKSCGLIGVDNEYNISFTKNTEHMPVAFSKENEEINSTI